MHALDVEPRLQRHQQVFSLMPGAAVDGLFRDGVLPVGAGDRILASWRELEPEMEGMDELGGFQHLELHSSLPDELLLYADKLSMAHGLEIRVPYLDREVVAYAERLPARFKIRFGQRKWLHRRVCREFLPADILARKKRGFAVDAVDSWFRSGGAGLFAGHLLDRSSLLFEFLQPEAVSRLLTDHRLGRSDNHKLLFSLVVLEEWLRAGRSAAAAKAPPSEALAHRLCSR